MVAERPSGGRSIRIDLSEDEAIVEVREADGRPASGVAVAWRVPGGKEGLTETDVRGHVRVDAPPSAVQALSN